MAVDKRYTVGKETIREDPGKIWNKNITTLA